ncbi:hypothetical protein AX16_002872 [Volvariella volvacea WC 439]|nr:hypothetical protein AX16_002872 [Volvariella volvacea WC 439]
MSQGNAHLGIVDFNGKPSQSQPAVHRNVLDGVSTAQSNQKNDGKQVACSSSEEITRLRKELDHGLEGLDMTIQKLREDLELERQKSVDLQDVIRTLQRVINDLECSNKEKDTQLSTIKKELDDTRKQLEAEADEHSGHIKTVGHNARDIQEQLTTTKEQLDETQKLLHEITEEFKRIRLDPLPRLVPRKDAICGRELKEMVESLNQEVLQTSLTIIDSLDFKEPLRRKLSAEERAYVLPQLEVNLPRTLLARLTCHHPISDGVEEEFGVQIALQAIMTEYACYYSQSWCPSDDQLDSHLRHIYQGLYESDPLMAPQWRSMTRSQVRQRTLFQDIRTIDIALRSQLSLLLSACGWTDDYLLSNERHAEVISRGIEVITEKIVQLNKAIYEDLTQDEVKILWFKSGSQFQSDSAHDGFSGVQRVVGQILCTTDLGVQISTPSAGGDSAVTTLKAKVFMNDLLLENYQAGEGKSKEKQKKHEQT